MSLLKTKPSWAPDSIATNRGWVNPRTNEVLVAIGNLKSKLEAEQVGIVPVIEVEPKENIMQEQQPVPEDQKQKRVYNKKPKVVTEVVEQQPVNIIGEVVEYQLDKVIGE